MSFRLKDLKPAPQHQPAKTIGKVVAVKGPLIFAQAPQVSIGNLCLVQRVDGSFLECQAVSFQDDLVTLAPFDYVEGIAPGGKVINTGSGPTIKFSQQLIGEVVDSFGVPLNKEKAKLIEDSGYTILPIFAPPPNPLKRKIISEQFVTGISSIDCFLSLGKGQRVGLFASAGLGKSTLLGMIARNGLADVNVIALIGERGREVMEFIEDSLGEEGLTRSIVVVATSDESPIRRKTAAFTATAIAEYFREQGKDVLLMMDSLTRTARAIREVGLASGELPVRQGYTPSVYTELPRLLERAGNSDKGTISAIYTVLTAVEGSMDSLADEIKSILDGHLVLSNNVIADGIRPAIDIPASVSRVINKVRSSEDLVTVNTVLSLLHRVKKDRDILLFGGTPDEELQFALNIFDQLKPVLNQTPAEKRSFEQYWNQVKAILAENQKS